jgi:hypothetical protein
LIWVPFMAVDIVVDPDVLLTFPIIAAFLVTLVHFARAYRMRVAVSFGRDYRVHVGAVDGRECRL